MNYPAEVICQHGLDGKIMPIKVRITDENGERQQYLIKAYKELPPGRGSTEGGRIPATNSLHRYDCKIEAFGSAIDLSLYYNSMSGKWNAIV